MLGVIIADDEHKIRAALKKLIRWEELDLQLLCECEDGDELVAQAEKLHPDIILTDMRMPGVNGEELLRILRAENERVKILVLSGFDEFGLVHQALMSKAADYLRKPVETGELNAALRRAAEQYRAEYQSHMEEERRSRREYLEAFLQGGQDDLAQFLAGCQMEAWPGQCFRTLVFGLYKPDGRPDLDSVDPFRCQLVSALGSRGCACADKKREGSVIAVVSFPEEPAERGLLEGAYALGGELGTWVLAGVGCAYENHREIQVSYREAVMALYQSPIGTEAGPVWYRDIESRTAVVEEREDKLYLLQAAAESGHPDQFLQGVPEAYRGLVGQPGLPLARLRRCNDRMLRLTEELLTRLQAPGQWHKELHDLEYRLRQVIVPETCEAAIIDFLKGATATFSSLRGERKELAYTIRDYLQQHYREKLSLQDLADRLYLNKGYVSKLFKQEFSIGVFDYVDFLRIEEAKELFRAGHTVREVTELVGYYDESHLNRKFKKRVGIVPKDFKS
ncbi:MAG: response regulator [Pseudoflavonifractor sp.]